MQALGASLQRDPAPPFILLADAPDEEAAIACLKAGAADDVFRDRLGRLPFAVAAAIHHLPGARAKQRDGRVAGHLARLSRADGAVLPASITGVPQYDQDNIVGAIGAVTDLTEPAHLTGALGEGERNFRALFNTIDHLLFVLDDQGRILLTNDAVTRRLGYAPGELVGQSVLVAHPPDRREEAARITADMLAGKAVSCPVPVMTRDGRRIPVETRVVKGTWSGREVIIGITRDLSALKASEEKFARSFQISPALMAISDPRGSPRLCGYWLALNQPFVW